jgi:vacuolar-type H+-ATPase subunit F/Vma7
MTVRVLSRRALSPGFQLAGLAVTLAENGHEAAAAVRRIVADPDVGMVLVDEALYHALPRDLQARLDRQALPIIAPVPAPRWDEHVDAEAYILEILRRAIGYRVRPR